MAIDNGELSKLFKEATGSFAQTEQKHHKSKKMARRVNALRTQNEYGTAFVA